MFAEAEASMRAYTPYGYRADQGGPVLGFTGQPRDANTGCYLLGNGRRAFNPRLMRFHSPDDMSPFSAGGLNAYAYCAGDPINRSDPSGRSWLDWLVQGIFATGNAVTIGAGVSFRGNHHANPSGGVVSWTQRLTDQYISRALTTGGSTGLVARGAAVGAMISPARAPMLNQLGSYANAVSGTLVVSATLIYEGRAAYRWWNQAAAAGRSPGHALKRGAYEATSLDLVVGAAMRVGRGAVSAGRTVVAAAGDVVNAVTGAVAGVARSIANRWSARASSYDIRNEDSRL
ncbi:RHS repeat-associated core domain-containing protein [Pseudomonas sp. NPDC089422]|uniref:RHS repeat-associated core domain-containing protein n=1 Tax=Pseudomonas sp. NPDC089422 TaxID=3364466 RepID=UPI00380B49B2